MFPHDVDAYAPGKVLWTLSS